MIAHALCQHPQERGTAWSSSHMQDAEPSGALEDLHPFRVSGCVCRRLPLTEIGRAKAYGRQASATSGCGVTESPNTSNEHGTNYQDRLHGLWLIMALTRNSLQTIQSGRSLTKLLVRRKHDIIFNPRHSIFEIESLNTR